MKIRSSNNETEEEPLVKLSRGSVSNLRAMQRSRTKYSQFCQTLANGKQHRTNSHMPETSANGEKLFLRDDALFSLRENEMFAQIESLITLSFQAALISRVTPEEEASQISL